MKKIIVYIFISAILFSTMEVTLKIVSIGIDPFQITFIRFIVLSETIALNTIIGILLIFIGSYLTMNRAAIKKMGKDYGN